MNGNWLRPSSGPKSLRKRRAKKQTPPPEKAPFHPQKSGAKEKSFRPQKMGVQAAPRKVGWVAGKAGLAGDGEPEGYGSKASQLGSDQGETPLDGPPVDPPADNVVRVSAEALEARRHKLRSSALKARKRNGVKNARKISA